MAIRYWGYAVHKFDCMSTLQDNWTALLNAAKYGHTEVVSDLLDVNADIEHRDMVSLGGNKKLVAKWLCSQSYAKYNVVLLQGGQFSPKSSQ